MIRGAPTLSEALYAAFGVEVDAIVTLKTVTGVVGKDGMRYIWKPARPRDTERRLAVVARIAEAMSADGLPAAGPLASRHGERLIETDSGPGYLQPWLPGRHVRLSDAEERLTAVCTVAQVHRWSRRVPFLADPHLGGPEWQNVTGGVLPVKLRSKLQALHGVWGPAKDACPELAAVEKDVFRVSEEVVAAVEKAWQAHGGTCRTLCHRDLAPHNLLWMTRAWPVSLIDFDHAGLDDPFLDFMQLLNHTFYLGDPGPRPFLTLVEACVRVEGRPIWREELLWQVLRFPDLLIRAMVEWVKAGSAPDGKQSLIGVIYKERTRWQRWAQDVHSRFG